MRWTLLLVPIVLIAAAPSASIDELIRRRNAAAVALYKEAETRATDPGLIAFNKACALYQLALVSQSPDERRDYFRQAAQHYRCATEDAADRRRLRARFGLANSLVQGRPDEAGALKDAIASYRDCLHNPALDEGTGIDVRHNLEVARLLLLRAQTKSADSEELKNIESGEKPKKPESKESDPKPPMTGDDGMKGDTTPKPTDQPADVKDGGKPQQTDKTTPGLGKEPVLFDNSSAPSLSAAEADVQLKQAFARIQKEQRERRLRSARTPAGTVKDW